MLKQWVLWGTALIVSLYSLFISRHDISYSSALVPDSSRIDDISDNSPQQTVESIYTDYLNCLPSPPESVYNVTTVFCHQHNDLVRVSLGNVSTNSTIDPLICASTLPSSVQMEKVVWKSPTVAEVMLKEYYPQKIQNIAVQTNYSHSQWQITSVQCM